MSALAEQPAQQQMKRQKQALSTAERRLFEAVDFGRMEARLHAGDAIKLLVAFAKDETLDVETRVECANDVLDRAYGKPGVPGEWQRVEVAITTAVDEVEVAERIAAATAAANRMAERDRYLGRVHPDQWPEWLRQEFGDVGIAAYSDLMNEAGD